MRLPTILAGPLASLASRLGRQNAFAPGDALDDETTS